MSYSVLNLRTPPFLQFRVPAVPVAQPRPRAVMRGNHAGMAPPPNKHPIHDFRASVRQALAIHYRGRPLDGPLEMWLVFVMPRPQRLIWKTRPMPREWYSAAKNDWDNLGKGVSDAMNGLLYRDDGQLADVHVKRVIAAGDEQPHVEITVELLEEMTT